IRCIVWLGVFTGVRNASVDNCIEVYALLEVVMSEQSFALKSRLLQCAVRSKVGGERRSKKPMNSELLKCVVAECADDARHKTVPAIRLREPVTELCAMRIWRQCSDDANGPNEVA